MYQQIRLYPKTEPDLIMLRLYYGAGFQRIVYQCVESVLSGGSYTIPFPKDFQEGFSSTPLVVALKFKDENVNIFLKSVKFRLKGCIIKEMIRSCYDQFPFWLFQEAAVSGLDDKEISKNANKTPEVSQNKQPEYAPRPASTSQENVRETHTSASASGMRTQAPEHFPEMETINEENNTFDITQLLDSLVQM